MKIILINTIVNIIFFELMFVFRNRLSAEMVMTLVFILFWFIAVTSYLNVIAL